MTLEVRLRHESAATVPAHPTHTLHLSSTLLTSSLQSLHSEIRILTPTCPPDVHSSRASQNTPPSQGCFPHTARTRMLHHGVCATYSRSPTTADASISAAYTCARLSSLRLEHSICRASALMWASALINSRDGPVLLWYLSAGTWCMSVVE